MSLSNHFLIPIKKQFLLVQKKQNSNNFFKKKIVREKRFSKSKNTLIIFFSFMAQGLRSSVSVANFFIVFESFFVTFSFGETSCDLSELLQKCTFAFFLA